MAHGLSRSMKHKKKAAFSPCRTLLCLRRSPGAPSIQHLLCICDMNTNQKLPNHVPNAVLSDSSWLLAANLLLSLQAVWMGPWQQAFAKLSNSSSPAARLISQGCKYASSGFGVSRTSSEASERVHPPSMSRSQASARSDSRGRAGDLRQQRRSICRRFLPTQAGHAT